METHSPLRVFSREKPEIRSDRKMGGGKSACELIPNARARRIAYEKRKTGLMKKAPEFSVLCDVHTCVVVFPAAATGGDRPTAPEIWPPNSGEARRVIERYISARSRDAFVDRRKKKLDLGRAGELSRDLSESQLRSLLSNLDDRVDLAKRKLAAMKEEKSDGRRDRLCKVVAQERG